MPERDASTGYAHPLYAQALAELGTPRRLPGSGATVLERRIPGTAHHDAMGCYPLLACRDWSKLEADLDALTGQLVCFSAVADPFGSYDLSTLRGAFPDVARPFKEHYVVELGREPDSFVTSHHRRNARKALRGVSVEACKEPRSLLPEWIELYANLVRRHQIHGITAFSSTSFEHQLSVPGMTVLRALSGERTVGMLLWYRLGNVAYYHLGAYSDEGYDLKASFALFRYAIDHFRAAGLEWLDLGAGAGLSSDGVDGLSRFKQGWSTGTRPAFFCGRILDPVRYLKILSERSLDDEGFFPAYRRGEWGA